MFLNLSKKSRRVNRKRSVRLKAKFRASNRRRRNRLAR
jgi:hypothetical protein